MSGQTPPSPREAGGGDPPSPFPPDPRLLDLLDALRRRNYAFVTPLNSTVRLVRERRASAKTLRDVLGWSLPFKAGTIDEEVEGLLERAGLLQACDGLVRSIVRASSFPEGLFLHSAYPARGDGAVFLGPDTYRFAEFLRRELTTSRRGLRVLDVGAGAGVGGVVAGGLSAAREILLTDVNAQALRFAAANATYAGVAAHCRQLSGVARDAGRFDIIVANPPFIAAGGAIYSDGGEAMGLGLSQDWAAAAVDRLAPGGRLLLYTGSPIIDGRDAFAESMAALARSTNGLLSYRELDPDIFGGQLRRRAYAEVERIAAVGVCVTADPERREPPAKDGGFAASAGTADEARRP